MKEVIIGKQKYDIDVDDNIILVFDCDSNFDKINKVKKSKVETVKDIVDDLGFKICFLNYSFEIWILNHFEKVVDVYDSSSGELELKVRRNLNLLNSLYYEYKSDKQIYDKLKGKLDVAIKNSDELLKEREEQGIEIYSKESNPVTQVGELIKQILEDFKNLR